MSERFFKVYITYFQKVKKLSNGNAEEINSIFTSVFKDSYVSMIRNKKKNLTWWFLVRVNISLLQRSVKKEMAYKHFVNSWFIILCSKKSKTLVL